MKKILFIAFAVTCCSFFFLQATADYRGFTITKSESFPDRNCKLVQLEHKKTGLRIVHVQNDDPENLFAFCFRTTPTKSHGVAHVLEHSVLDGSEKFPVRGLLFKLMEGTFATYLNASTSGGSTYYPAASQYPDDFYNLMEVYADACFHPLLTKETFHKEGHRVEFETFDDPTTALVYKGVVFNEMKGAMANPLTQLYFANNQELFCDALGEVRSGGEPHIIPELTYEELVQFHKDHYYPGNCILFLYGNIPLERHLDFLAENVLEGHERRPPVPERPLQPQFDAPRYKELVYASNQDRSFVSVGWMMNPTEEERLALELLEHVLLGSDAAPCKHALMQSGLCTDVGAMVEADRRQLPFIFVFDGAKAHDAHKIESILLDQLQKFVTDPDAIERIIAQVELRESDLRPTQRPVGLELLYSVGLTSFEGNKPEHGLQLQKRLGRLQEKLKDGFLERLIKCHFIDNPHRVTLSLTPSVELETERHQQEQDRLRAMKAALSEKEIQAIIDEAQFFRMNNVGEYALPKRSLDSISQDILEIPLVHSSHDGLDLHHSKVYTNHISYVSFEFALPALAQNELWKTGLYGYLLPQLGSRGRSYQQTLEHIERYTGGLGVSFAKDIPTITLQTKGLDKNQNVLFELLYDTLTTANFTDKERIRQLIIKHAADLEAALVNQSVDLAITATLSFHSKERYFEQQMSGLDYIEKVLDLAKNLDTRLDQLLIDLQSLQKRIVPYQMADLLLTSEIYNPDHLLSTLIKPEASVATEFVLPQATSMSYPVGTNVAFNARGFSTAAYEPYLLLVSELVTRKYLVPMIREQRGAYDARAIYEPHTGNFYMRSYRDPHIKSTNEIFCYAIERITAGDITPEDLLKAKISALRALDMPKSPAVKAESAYLNFYYGRSDADRREFRRKLLNANVSDIKHAASEHLVPCFDKSALVTLGSSKLIESHCNQ